MLIMKNVLSFYVLLHQFFHVLRTVILTVIIFPAEYTEFNLVLHLAFIRITVECNQEKREMWGGALFSNAHWLHF